MEVMDQGILYSHEIPDLWLRLSKYQLAAFSSLGSLCSQDRTIKKAVQSHTRASFIISGKIMIVLGPLKILVKTQKTFTLGYKCIEK